MDNSAIYKKHFRTALLFSIASSTALTGASGQETSTFPMLEAQIREVASRILRKAGKANCKPHDCKILVANFTYASGLTSQLGVQLADQFSKELASQQDELQILARPALRSYLEQERIPAAFLNSDQSMRWLGKQFDANAMLTGLIEDRASSMHVKIQLLSCDKEKSRLEEELTLPPASDLKDSLAGVEAFSQQPPNTDVFADSSIRQAGKSGVTQPSCIYCPNPEYTDAARKAKFSGSVVLEVVVAEQGRPVNARIIRGIPYGLSEASVDIVLRNWKLKPALLNGKPVAVKVPIEVVFRLAVRAAAN